MTPFASTVIAYVVIAALLWAYAGHLFLACRRAEKQRRQENVS